MRFSSAFFASLAAQAVFAGVLPTLPAKTGVKSLDVALSVVDGTQKAVRAEGAAIVTFVDEDLLPLAKTSLANVAGQLQSVKDTVTPYAVGVIEPLAEAQLANVLNLVFKSHLLVNDVKDLSTKLLANGDEQVKKAFAAELKAVLDAVNPLVEPITTLSKGLTGPSTSAIGKQVFKSADLLQYTAGAALDPLRDAVNKLV